MFQRDAFHSEQKESKLFEIITQESYALVETELDNGSLKV